jgi:hypothetical protein
MIENGRWVRVTKAIFEINGVQVDELSSSFQVELKMCNEI